ncbi:MAG: teichoic acid biosynthesis-like protein, partial [Elusimicrobia bacterium]
MARILYGVSGEGSGHATRSKEIISGLVKKHRVKVLAYGKSYDLLKDYFDTQKIYGLHLYYRDGSVDYLRTALANLRRLPAELGGTLAGVK